MTPSFFRIASGGAEHLTIVQAESLPKVVKKLQQRGVAVYALSQHAERGEVERPSPHMGIVLGAENDGISHALMRQCEGKLALKPLGKNPSLNVSVAAAVAMERLFYPRA